MAKLHELTFDLGVTAPDLHGDVIAPEAMAKAVEEFKASATVKQSNCPHCGKPFAGEYEADGARHCPGCEDAKETNVDGLLHTTYDHPTSCDCHGQCSRCGGREHTQAMHDGLARFCECCPEDAGMWEPIGTYRHEEGIVKGLVQR
jgi:hypothetical protein